MRDPESHYEFLDVDMFAPRAVVQGAVERISKQANAMANTTPAHARELRDRLRQIKADLLESDARKNAYDCRLLEAQRHAARGADDIPLTAMIERQSEPASYRAGPRGLPRFPGPSARNHADADAASSHSNWLMPIWTAAALAVLVALAAAFVLMQHERGSAPAAAPPSSATASRAPTAKSRPTPTRTQITRGTLAEVERVVRLSNDRWSASMRCACDQGLEGVKTGGDLQSYLHEIQDLQSNAEHWSITLYSFNIASAHLDSPTSATAFAWKNELHQLLQGSTLVSSCGNPYEVRYHLIQENGLWKVDATSVVSGGC
jgi:ARC6-like, IMS domain